MTITALDTTGTSTRLASELVAVAEQLRRCTVQVRSHRLYGSGSGTIWNIDKKSSLSSPLLGGTEAGSLIITNAHVVPSPHATVELSDGRVIDAVRIAIDPRRDLAALKVEVNNLLYRTYTLLDNA